MPGKQKTRRDLLAPLPLKTEADARDSVTLPVGGRTVHVATSAMACEFCVVMNAGSHEDVSAVGEVLDLIVEVERWLSIYKPASEISVVNREADKRPVHIRRSFFELLQTCVSLHRQSNGAFDIAAGAQIGLWRKCREQQRIPTADEITEVLEQSGSDRLVLDSEATTVEFAAPGMALDPGAVGKGFALDEASDWLEKMPNCPSEFLLHGGHSSLVARGGHEDQGGWPVGIGNPLFTQKRLGTVLLKDQAMSTSGSNIQFFRHEGRRYGHILDPRSALPVDGMLSVTVFAESAAIADALSTAFFVLGVENAQKCCDNLGGVGAILIPFPRSGAKVTPTVIGVPDDQIFWEEDQVAPT